MNNNEATISKMRELKLQGMATAYLNVLETGLNEKYTLDELLTHLIDTEWYDRRERKRERLRKGAGFRYHATFDEIDFTLKRNLDKNQMLRLSDAKWIRQHKDILITGPRRVSEKASSEARWAALPAIMDTKWYYHLTGRMLGALKEAKKSGMYL